MDEDDRWNKAAVLTQIAMNRSNGLLQLPIFMHLLMQTIQGSVVIAC